MHENAALKRGTSQRSVLACIGMRSQHPKAAAIALRESFHFAVCGNFASG
ncbi:hypothetical protein CEV32_2143 [Brucella rhizosphaerae]|uniref:Uncharacterized protein n=1 Tax=Brucella rhizosphaerae TaxID=571254 RepID=A0A256F4D5_9HYPH|nr:hypothetical protein CEV32_2143 [Brucella rhizosphaerae]